MHPVSTANSIKVGHSSEYFSVLSKKLYLYLTVAMVNRIQKNSQKETAIHPKIGSKVCDNFWVVDIL